MNHQSPDSSQNVSLAVSDNDPRVILAAERTLLAWIRTGLAMMGFGFLVAKFGLFLQELVILQGGQPGETPRWSVWIGAAMVALGVITNLITGLEHWRYLRRRIYVSNQFQRGYWMGIIAAVLLAVVGIIMVIYLIALK